MSPQANELLEIAARCGRVQPGGQRQPRSGSRSLGERPGWPLQARATGASAVHACSWFTAGWCFCCPAGTQLEGQLKCSPGAWPPVPLRAFDEATHCRPLGGVLGLGASAVPGTQRDRPPGPPTHSPDVRRVSDVVGRLLRPGTVVGGPGTVRPWPGGSHASGVGDSAGRSAVASWRAPHSLWSASVAPHVPA